MDKIEEIVENIEQYKLGETDEEFVCISEEHNQIVAVAMIKQAEFHLDILSQDFDPDVYDNQECFDVIEDLALRSRYSRIRILLHNTKKVSQRGHLIFYLGKRLGSLIQFRSIAEIHKHIPDTFMLVDGIGIMHRPHTDTLAATINFKDRPKTKKLLQLFNKIWEDSEPDPESRYVVI
ncbi:hypothetical protein QUF74_11510 [Candidatus Halobeggiatoa sp. HSG11]|nr:hypothetical protein [Candidatus Halobeggiatoa sp. HSG11]